MTSRPYGYKEYDPAEILKPYLACYWSYFVDVSDSISDSKPIIPDGCIDIIFDLNCPAGFDNFVVGAMTRPITSHKTNLIGVRFKPGTAHHFLNIPLHQITNQLVEYREFVKQSELNLTCRLAELDSIFRQKNLLNQIFMEKLIDFVPIESPVNRAIRLIELTGGHCTINHISKQVGWSRQHLTRKCLEYVGISPKFFTRVVRLKRTIAQYKTEKFLNWCQLSVDGGYFDQAHMINEFRVLTGLTPY